MYMYFINGLICSYMLLYTFIYQTTDEYLTCKICHVPGFKDPRVLPCGHSFCRACLEKQSREMVTITCALCGHFTLLPEGGVAGLSRNLFTDTQVDRLLRRHNNFLGPAGCRRGFYNISQYWDIPDWMPIWTHWPLGNETVSMNM